MKSIEYKLEPKFFPWKEILRAMCEEVASRKKDFDLAGVRWRGKYVDEEGKEWTGLPLFEDCRDHEDLARRGCGKSTLNHLNKKKAEYMKDLRLLPKKLAQKHQQIKVEQEAQKRKEKEIEKKRQQIIWEERERAKARREIELEEQNATPTDIDGSGAATAPPDAGQSEQKETEAVRSEKSLRKVNLNRFAIVLKYPVQEVPTAGLHQSIGSGKLLRLGTIVTQKKHTLFNFLAEAANQGDFAFITENKSAVSRLRKAIRQTAEQNGIEILGDPLPWDGPNRYRSAIPVRIAPDNYKSEGHLPYQDDPWYDRVKNSCEH
ncbi:MAG TPA: hypothetical protein PLY86_21480 [bacterium]|nr:hypothetical protein [bacterium]